MRDIERKEVRVAVSFKVARNIETFSFLFTERRSKWIKITHNFYTLSSQAHNDTNTIIIIINKWLDASNELL